MILSLRRNSRSASGVLRSMRRRDAWSRVRALVLLVAFAIGTILARDAALVQQSAMIRAAQLGVIELAAAASPSVETKAKPKLRPSAVNKRLAYTPFDPPGDDDETDEDSDTFAAEWLAVAVAVAARIGDVVPVDTVVEVPPAAPSTGRRVVSLPSPRGPPSVRRA